MSEPGLVAEFLASAGLKTQDLVAGLLGGLASSLAFRKGDPVAIVSSMVVGAVTANYLSEVVSKYTGTSIGTAAFLVGVGGMAICQTIVAAATKWKPAFLKGGGDGV